MDAMLMVSSTSTLVRTLKHCWQTNLRLRKMSVKPQPGYGHAAVVIKLVGLFAHVGALMRRFLHPMLTPIGDCYEVSYY